MEHFEDESRPPTTARSFGNNWHDCVMGEIELGSWDAYVAMACDYDVGISRIHVQYIFEHDDAHEEGREMDESPWGPWGAMDDV